MSAIVNAATSASGSSSTTSTSTPTLGENDFLQLLVTEMQNQDPLQPMDDTQTVAEMAQFSSLEQMTNLNTSASITQATSLIGKTISWTDSTNTLQSGAVTSVNIVSGAPELMVGTTEVALSSVSAIATTSTTGD